MTIDSRAVEAPKSDAPTPKAPNPAEKKEKPRMPPRLPGNVAQGEQGVAGAMLPACTILVPERGKRYERKLEPFVPYEPDEECDD